MNGDLSLSQSLGGLRIANPDSASSEDPASRRPSTSPLSSSLPLATEGAVQQDHSVQSDHSVHQDHSVPPISTESSGRPLSQLDFDPNSFSTDSIVLEKPNVLQEKQVPVSPIEGPFKIQRKNSRQSISLTYQDQQQAQFPQYPGMVPQQQRQSNLSRPPTQQYPYQSQANNMPTRDRSYRQHKELTSISGLPHRSSSRGAATAMQAGVPTREDSYTDRDYRQGQNVHNGNGPLPPRRSSRGMKGAFTSNGSGSRVGASNGSPYGLEGGPLASSEEWQDRGAALGVRREIDANGRSVARYVKKGVKDFHFGRTLGEGSYSTVLAATDRETNKEYAIKVLDKRHIIKEKKVKYVNIEKDTLNRLTDHPGVVRLYYTFQDERSLYFVLDIASGGELLGVLKKLTTFDEECTRFYGAQILDTIDYMHSRGVIHRDLKPENVLMDDQMHVKITDFGTAKILDVPQRQRAASDAATIPLPGDPLDGSEDNRATSFVGTAEYVSPELLTDKNACKASDLWAFGCIIYQLLAGRPPFKAGNEYQTFQKIVGLDYSFPQGFPPVARDLVERLLVLDPSRRLTIEHIKNHEFFDGISWGRGLWSQKAPKLKSYRPPAPEPINLNGHGVSNGVSNGNGNSFPPDIAASYSSKVINASSGSINMGPARPSPRVITELPPPSQLDIEWSPVLTRNNERILKLGNLLVLSAPTPHSPSNKHNGQNGDGSKFSRFFGGNNSKKRQRLVMVTSSARIIMAAAGGDEKKTKTEISLLSAGCSWRKMQDSKGLSYWCIDTREKHYTFEDPKAASSDGSATSSAAQEWIDAMDRAREIALSHSQNNSYSGDEFKDLQSGLPSPTNTLDMAADRRTHSTLAMTGRNNLKKHPSISNPDELKGFKRFSKRQSKSGFPSVF
ncbi:pkb-activating kinase-like protein [Xylographa pallens]|nr:pkb-activating kinase-like protein [Xylographa pallens]